MEKIIRELEKIFRFKETTVEGDIVVVAAEQIMYALVKEISRDRTGKDEWWQVTMHLLTVPPQKVTWTLREPQFTGREIFTMGGKQRFIKALDFSEPKLPRKSTGPAGPGKTKNPKKTGPSLRVVK